LISFISCSYFTKEDVKFPSTENRTFNSKAAKQTPNKAARYQKRGLVFVSAETKAVEGSCFVSRRRVFAFYQHKKSNGCDMILARYASQSSPRNIKKAILYAAQT